jgi:dipeptidase E
MRLLLFSNSTNAGEEYLFYTLPYIEEFLLTIPSNAIFIPYAAISISWDEYYSMVAEKLESIGIQITSAHHKENVEQAIENADLIIVGGGNTFHLLKTLQEKKLLDIIRNKARSGTPYIGWSAGSNLTCPTIKTTNDMPVVEPHDFNALGLIPFQINPHYTDYVDKKHAGETREMRIQEFIKVNHGIFVAGLREGTLFQVEGNSIELKGEKSCKIFKYDQTGREIKPGEDFSFLMQ